MLRNLENIWSEILVNSEEFAMFAVPKFYTSEMLCLYISDNRNIAGFFRCTYLFQVCRVLANRRKGSASSFMKNIINQIFRHMPKPSENLKSGDNSALTSTQPSEKGKSQSKLEKEIISIQKKVSKLQEECRHEMKSIACCATSISIVQHCTPTSTEVTRLIPKTGKRYTVSSWIWIKK